MSKDSKNPRKVVENEDFSWLVRGSEYMADITSMKEDQTVDVTQSDFNVHSGNKMEVYEFFESRNFYLSNIIFI